MKILIPGIAGQLGRLVALRLLDAGHEVLGIDRRPWPEAPRGLEIHQLDIRKRTAEDVFRRRRPDAVIHMATVTHLRDRSDDRYRINLGGTRAVFENCHAYGVRHVIFVGRHTYYGAGPDVPVYHREDEPPMSGSHFPELSDLVAADLYAGSALWRFPEMTTTVLRTCYTLGPSKHGTLAAYLRGPRVPTILGFDPLFQFMHEADVAQAIVLAVEKKIRGVYNVSGPPPLPLSVMIREAGRIGVPVPAFLFLLLSGRYGFPYLSEGAIAHIKYPVVVDSSLFREATGFVPSFDEDQTLAAFREA
jgi:UDP-glucose 4-epimerase